NTVAVAPAAEPGPLTNARVRTRDASVRTDAAETDHVPSGTSDDAASETAEISRALNVLPNALESIDSLEERAVPSLPGETDFSDGTAAADASKEIATVSRPLLTIPEASRST